MRSPVLEEGGLRVFEGSSLDVLAEMPTGSVDCVVTSPPYWSLRDYNQPGQLGLEPTPEAFADALVEVFAEVRRVLVPWGTLWLNVGDSYASKARGSDAGWEKSRLTNPGSVQKAQAASIRKNGERHRGKGAGLKNKDLVGIPWEVAFALRRDGWWLRAECIWSKANPMPESTRDRPTKAHEQVFLLAASETYFYDRHAILEEHAGVKAGNKTRKHGSDVGIPGGRDNDLDRGVPWEPTVEGRNARSVWAINTSPSAMGLCPVCHAFWPRNSPDKHCGTEVVQHYAAFPADLPEKALLAGTSAEGVCAACRRPMRRLVRLGAPELAANTWSPEGMGQYDMDVSGWAERAIGTSSLKHVRTSTTVAWEPTCECGAGLVPAVVLDPFSGSGTTLLAARRHGRHSVGIELNPHYVEMTGHRLQIPDVIASAAETSTEPTQLALG